MSATRPANETITRVHGIRVGHATDTENFTGCTVVLVSPEGVRCVADIRGGAPGTRETALLSEHVAKSVHAIVLSGGSAFGLATADGVMSWLAARGIGFPTVAGPVPIVPAAILYDLAVGASVPPTATMGREACERAMESPVERGSIGVGTGATVGKLHGPTHAMQGGVGSAAYDVVQAGETYTVGALVAVNAIGDIWDVATNRIVAGAHDDRGWLSQRNDRRDRQPTDATEGTNTTLCVVATDAPVTRMVLTRMAISAHDGIARAIRPAHTIADGDIVFALTTARDERPLTIPETIQLTMTVERAVETAIVDAVRSAVARDLSVHVSEPDAD